MNKNILSEITGQVGRRIEYGKKAVKKTVGTPLASWTLAVLSVGGVGAYLNSARNVQAGGGPSRMACDGVINEWSVDGVPTGSGTEPVRYQFNLTNEDNRVEDLSGGKMKIYNNQNGSTILDLVAKANQELILTEVFGGATTDADVVPNANHTEGFRTKVPGIFSNEEKVILRAQMFQNALDGNPSYSGFFFVSGNTGANDFKSTFYTRSQFVALAADLKAQRDIICAPTPTSTATETAIATATATATAKAPEPATATKTSTPVTPSQSPKIDVPESLYPPVDFNWQGKDEVVSGEAGVLNPINITLKPGQKYVRISSNGGWRDVPSTVSAVPFEQNTKVVTLLRNDTDKDLVFNNIFYTEGQTPVWSAISDVPFQSDNLVMADILKRILKNEPNTKKIEWLRNDLGVSGTGFRVTMYADLINKTLASVKGYRDFVPAASNPELPKPAPVKSPEPVVTPKPDLTPISANLSDRLGGVEYFKEKNFSTNEKKTFQLKLDRFTIVDITSNNVKVNGKELRNLFGENTTGVWSLMVNSDMVVTFDTDADQFTGFEFMRTQGAGNRDQEVQDTILSGQVVAHNLLNNAGNCGLPTGCKVVTQESYWLENVNGATQMTQLQRQAYKK